MAKDFIARCMAAAGGGGGDLTERVETLENDVSIIEGDIESIEQQIEAIDVPADLKDRLEALELQCVGAIGLTQDSRLNIRLMTRAQYEQIVPSADTLYAVQDTDLTMTLYIGDQPINNSGGGVGVVFVPEKVIVPVYGVKAIAVTPIVFTATFEQ